MMNPDTPPSPRALKLLAVAFAISIVVGVLLFSGNLPGLRPNYAAATTVTVDGRPYFWSDYTIPWPPWPENFSEPNSTTFHHATFWFWVTGWYGIDTAYLHGNATPANGSTSPDFALGGPASPDRQTLYLGDGGTVGAQWDGLTPYVELLVLDNATS
jgi:hypothetical protein